MVELETSKRKEEQKAPQELTLECGETVAVVALNGACVRSFSVSEKDILFPDGEVEIKGKRKRRGGIPLLFPWAGPLEEVPHLPQHGFARDLVWEDLGAPREVTGRAALLELRANPETTKMYHYPFSLHLQIEVGDNWLYHLFTVGGGSSRNPIPIAPGIHPYFKIPSGGISRIETNISGFDPTKYKLGEPLVFPPQEVELKIPEVGVVKIVPGDAFKRKQARLIVWSDNEKYICVEPWSAPLGGFLEPDERIMVGERWVKFSTKISLQPE